jgi:hypothetical protein
MGKNTLVEEMLLEKVYAGTQLLAAQGNSIFNSCLCASLHMRYDGSRGNQKQNTSKGCNCLHLVFSMV